MDGTPGRTTTLNPPSRGAVEYRAWLTRTWDDSLWGGSPAVFVMLNPSTADQHVDDPTIRRCVRFATREGYSSLIVVNLYALRATDPDQLWAHPDPVGRPTTAWAGNDAAISDALCDARRMGDGRVIVAWGANARADRVDEFRQMASRHQISLWALGTTQSGAPRHPLYVLGTQPLTRWSK